MLPRRNHLPMIYKMQLALVNFGKPWNELRFFKLDNDLTTFVISIVPRPFPLFWFEIRFWEIESLPKREKLYIRMFKGAQTKEVCAKICNVFSYYYINNKLLTYY